MSRRAGTKDPAAQGRQVKMARLGHSAPTVGPRQGRSPANLMHLSQEAESSSSQSLQWESHPQILSEACFLNKRQVCTGHVWRPLVEQPTFQRSLKEGCFLTNTKHAHTSIPALCRHTQSPGPRAQSRTTRYSSYLFQEVFPSSPVIHEEPKAWLWRLHT